MYISNFIVNSAKYEIKRNITCTESCNLKSHMPRKSKNEVHDPLVDPQMQEAVSRPHSGIFLIKQIPGTAYVLSYEVW
jgi:hypothetical protein